MSAEVDGAERKAGDRVYTDGHIGARMLSVSFSTYVGITCVFLADFLCVFYLAKVADPDELAGVGIALMASAIMTMFNIGSATAAAIIVGKEAGSRSRKEAVSLVLPMIGVGICIAAIVSFALFICLQHSSFFVEVPTASLAAARQYLRIVIPTNVLLGAVMVSTSVLRAIGAPRPAMHISLAGAIAASMADPLFILYLDKGVTGAGLAIIVTRVVQVAVCIYYLAAEKGVLNVRMRAPTKVFKESLFHSLTAALSALASPIGAILLFDALMRFGSSAVAAYTVFDRIGFLFFGFILCVPGSFNAVAAQNLGAGNVMRVLISIRWACAIVAAVALISGAILFLFIDEIAMAFYVDSDVVAGMLKLLAQLAAPLWLSLGIISVCASAFQLVGKAYIAVAISWLRVGFALLPVWVLARFASSYSLTISAYIGFQAFFAIIVIIATFAVFRRSQRRQTRHIN